MALIYKKESLFNAPLGSILVHACNAQGVWGSGIAVEFKKRFPTSFASYHNFCVNSAKPPVGDTLIVGPEQGYYIGCLITSENFGVRKDPPDLILEQTTAAVQNLLRSLQSTPKPVPGSGLQFPTLPIPIYSNKFNSGFFGVPWEESEKVLKRLIGPTDWTIMDPNL